MAIEQKVLKAILMLRKLGNKSQTKEEQIAEQLQWLSEDYGYTEESIDEWIFIEELSEREAQMEYEERMSARRERDEWDDLWDDRARSVGAVWY